MAPFLARLIFYWIMKIVDRIRGEKRAEKWKDVRSQFPLCHPFVYVRRRQLMTSLTIYTWLKNWWTLLPQNVTWSPFTNRNGNYFSNPLLSFIHYKNSLINDICCCGLSLSLPNRPKTVFAVNFPNNVCIGQIFSIIIWATISRGYSNNTWHFFFDQFHTSFPLSHLVTICSKPQQCVTWHLIFS
jgi:hypothetical protein